MSRKSSKILLFLNSCLAHMKAPPLKAIQLSFFPAECSPLLQSLDQTFARVVKVGYRGQLVEKLLFHVLHRVRIYRGVGGLRRWGARNLVNNPGATWKVRDILELCWSRQQCSCYGHCSGKSVNMCSSGRVVMEFLGFWQNLRKLSSKTLLMQPSSR